MDNLITLSTLVSKQKLRKIPTVKINPRGRQKTDILFQELVCGKVKTDEDALILLYNDTSKTNALNNVKRRLKNKLINTLFFIDVNKPSFTDYRKALHTVGKNWAAVVLLLDRTARHAAISLAETTYTISLKYDLTEFSLLLARQIAKHYAYLDPNQKKYTFYKKEVEKIKVVFDAEMKAEDYYNKISHEFNISKSSKIESNKIILKKYCNELSLLQKNISSYRFNADTYQLLTYERLLNNDYYGIIKLSHEAKDFFDAKPFKDLLGQILFNYDLIRSYLVLKDFKNAERYLNENLGIITKHNFHWFRCRNFKFILLIHSKRYREIYSLWYEMLESNALKKFATFHEPWLIKEAYIHFLIHVGRIKEDKNKPIRKFRVTKFLNEVPLFSKDKRGLNISILIAQLLFFIINKKEDQIIDRLDSLNQYCHRYLRKDDTLRSNCFIKMLMKLPDADYNPIRVQRYVDKYYKVLNETPPEISEQSSEVEIIPYEDLWEMVIEVLEKRGKGR